LAADNIDAVLRLLSSTPYTQEVSMLLGGKLTNEKVDSLLLTHYTREFNALSRHLPGKSRRFAELYEKRFYINGLKSVIHGVHSGASLDEISEFLILSANEKTELENLATTGSIPRIIESVTDSGLRDALLLANSRYEDTGDIVHFDFVIDNYYYTSLVKGAKTLLGGHDKSVTLNYLGSIIDIINILSILRGIGFGIPEEQIQDYIINHFYRLKDIWRDLIKVKNTATILNILERTVYHSVAREFQKEIEKRSIREIEYIFQKLLLEQSKKLWLTPFTIGNFFAYIEGKKSEIQNLRSILLGKMGGLSENEIKILV
jgi:vacuolar-type H+-ATPase subunit C/Vma6